MSRDCFSNYTCVSPRKPANVSNKLNCSINSKCVEVNKNEFKCECQKGFKGDGFVCTKGKSLILFFWNFQLTFIVFLYFSKGQLGDKCSESELCDERLGLGCKNGTCECSESKYWKNNICGNFQQKKIKSKNNYIYVGSIEKFNRVR